MKKKFGPFDLSIYRPIIIAEVGVNHGGNFQIAKKYVDICKKAGADAIKFQTYKAENIAAKNSPAYWNLKKEKTKSQYDLFKKYDYLSYRHFKSLKQIADKKKILFMTTLFDHDSVDQYRSLLKVYKISSSDITNVPLLKKIGKMKAPTLLSTGSSTIKEIKFALKILSLPKNKVCIMHCVLNYPTANIHANLSNILKLKKEFPGYLIGYSDHTVADNNLTSIQYAYEMGASIIEKHFSHNNKLKGNDHYHSMNFEQLKNLNELYKKKIILHGNGKLNLRNQLKSRKFARRSIYSKTDIKIGEILSSKNITTLRPATGIPANKWFYFIGKVAKKNIKKNCLIRKNDLIF